MASTNGCTSVVASTPGGVARHFRVQYQSDPQADWQMYATFRTRDLATICLDELKESGYEARIVSYAICPAAG